MQVGVGDPPATQQWVSGQLIAAKGEVVQVTNANLEEARSRLIAETEAMRSQLDDRIGELVRRLDEWGQTLE